MQTSGETRPCNVGRPKSSTRAGTIRKLNICSVDLAGLLHTLTNTATAAPKRRATPGGCSKSMFHRVCVVYRSGDMAPRLSVHIRPGALITQCPRQQAASEIASCFKVAVSHAP